MKSASHFFSSKPIGSSPLLKHRTRTSGNRSFALREEDATTTTTMIPSFPPNISREDIETIEKEITSSYFLAIESIEALPREKRTWENTFATFSKALGKASEMSARVTLPSMTHASVEVRKESANAKDRYVKR
jgi:hypothetical protein|tara:strand:- start:1 stop:399 length:399 start_codon:yes stop_codon:yes gene_type:complete